MERDHKYSGTLPLLAYAPQDFGLNVQRSRAYRARAAMGRAGVQSMRSPVQAPALTEKAPVIHREPEQSSSLFARLWLRASGFFKVFEKKEPVGALSSKPVAVDQKTENHVAEAAAPTHSRILNRAVAEEQITTEGQVQAEVVTVQEMQVNEVAVSEPHQPVSKTYAAMRMSSISAVAANQSIPQAPDLAHALAEIRQALREHEKLANARQNENLPS